jgi:hypothetical protein
MGYLFVSSARADLFISNEGYSWKADLFLVLDRRWSELFIFKVGADLSVVFAGVGRSYSFYCRSGKLWGFERNMNTVDSKIQFVLI